MPPLQFAVDDRMRKNMDFWISIYTQYPTTQGLIHDAKYIDHVYEVLNFEGYAGEPEKLIKQSKKKWKAVLLSLHKKQKTREPLTEDEKTVSKLFDDVSEPGKFYNAAHRKRLRFQLGQKDRFLEGLKQSGRYLPLMEEIFKREGLPAQLTRLPFVESSFNVRARSKVGASGIWQFMRSTGRFFMKVNDVVDERNDPIRATEAAAKFLRLNFESLKTWPLAVTAYNHGRMGILRAIRKVGSTELEEVVNSYKSRSFGFASSNFFTELLAAIEVERNSERYFGKIERDKPLVFFEITLPDFIDINELSRFLRFDLAVVKELNPGLSEAVFMSRALIPAGYSLRLPQDPNLGREASARVFAAGYEQIPALYKQKAQLRLKYDSRKRIKTTQQ